ncbi:hypothetical protein TNCV_2781991 [Trichonephila clavipes]|nr:hypothetical protein TNCV_2781991 [Trichonephila clavipes]
MDVMRISVRLWRILSHSLWGENSISRTISEGNDLAKYIVRRSLKYAGSSNLDLENVLVIQFAVLSHLQEDELYDF